MSFVSVFFLSFFDYIARYKIGRPIKTRAKRYVGDSYNRAIKPVLMKGSHTEWSQQHTSHKVGPTVNSTKPLWEARTIQHMVRLRLNTRMSRTNTEQDRGVHYLPGKRWQRLHSRRLDTKLLETHPKTRQRPSQVSAEWIPYPCNAGYSPS